MAGNDQIAAIESDRAIDRNGSCTDVKILTVFIIIKKQFLHNIRYLKFVCKHNRVMPALARI